MKRKAVKSIIKKTAFEMAELNANQVCGFLFGQPKQPASVKKLRRF